MPSARVAEAIALWRVGRAEDAERACSAILAKSADDIDARHLLAEIHSARGEFPRAIEQLRRVARLRPQDASAARRLADALFAADDYRAAATAYRRGIALEPQKAR